MAPLHEGFGVSCQFGMNKYLEHAPVEAPFSDISNKLKDVGFSKGVLIKTKSAEPSGLRAFRRGVQVESNTMFQSTKNLSF